MERSLRIAVADDEPDMRDYYRMILPRLGHEVVAVAATGEDLVARCRETAPDLVITDIRMCDMDGIDAAVALNAARRVPVILISGYQDPELLHRAAAGHVLAYLLKPIKKSDLVPAIALAARQLDAT